MNGLIVFVKNLMLGKVKTRIAKDVGDHDALSIYKKMVQHTAKITTVFPVQKYIYYSDFVQYNDYWENNIVTKRTQTQSDLGTRMIKAFEQCLGNHQRVLLIGSDCMSIGTTHIQHAFAVLESNDVVLGPSEDGGFYLIGMKKMTPQIFDNVEWSTKNVLQQTITNIENLGKSYFLIEKLSDIDTLEDWHNWQKGV